MTVMDIAQRIREFKMPDVGEGLTEAAILKWYVKPGDTVTDGQVVCEIETAKAAVELPIPFDGVVHTLCFPEGEMVAVGEPIIAVGSAAEPEPEPAPAVESEAKAQVPAKRQPVLVGYGVATASVTRRARKQSTAPGPSRPPATGRPAPAGGQPKAKPPVRKLAKDLGIDLAAVRPTGPDGNITREDVQNALTPPAPAAAPPAAPTAAPPAAVAAAPTAAVADGPAGRETRVPVTGVRRATAQAMVASAFTAPHVTELVTFDITRTMRLVQQLKQDKAFDGLRVSPLLLAAKALLLALRRNPEANASWDEPNQEIVHKQYVNLGIAAATPRGLIVPNIKDAHTKTLPELAAALTELVATARQGKTTPAAMRDGTITITNIGVFGIDTGTPILNPGESAILVLGAVKEMPWVHHGKVKVRQITTLGLSFDHRLVDGELGSRVLADTAAVLERPKRLITWS